MPDKVRPLQAGSAGTQEMPVNRPFPTIHFLNKPGSNDAHIRLMVLRNSHPDATRISAALSMIEFRSG
jgi:hypothetical protein